MGAGFLVITGTVLAIGGLSADFGIQAFSKKGREQLPADLHCLATIVSEIPVEQFSGLLERMNTFDVQTVSKAISSMQAASKCEIWVSESVQQRLTAIEHSRASSTSSRESTAELKEAVARASATRQSRSSLTSGAGEMTQQ